jgi:hypothetical protein
VQLSRERCTLTNSVARYQHQSERDVDAHVNGGLSADQSGGGGF